MSFSTEEWLNWEYHEQNANCWHFAREVWRELTGVMLPFHPTRSVGEMMEEAQGQAARLVQLSAPQSPCLVLMLRQRIQPHIGVYWQGRVLHCTRFGASYQSLDHVTVGYPTVSYYTNANGQADCHRRIQHP